MSLMDIVRAGQFALIAEIGVNYHDIAAARGISAMDAAKLMIDEASAAGAHAVKFQSYRASGLVTRDARSYWDTSQEHETSQFELFAKYDAFGQAEYREIADYCSRQNVEFMSTAFDFEAADYLDELMDVYKISSSDITNLPFIDYQAAKGKPVILSTGAANLEEMRAAVRVIEKHGVEMVLMHCVLEYPTPYEHACLEKIVSLRNEFPSAVIGYSDHCRPDADYDVIKSAYLLGATVVEKHFTLDKTLPGNDHYHAMDPTDVAAIVAGVTFLDTLLGTGDLNSVESQQAARANARRSIVAACDIAEGTLVTQEMLTFKRPGSGLAPSRVDEVVGRTAKRAIRFDELVTLADLRETEL